MTARPLIIGYGNTLRRDDGVGVRVAELLRADLRFEGVDVLAVHQLTPELVVDIAAASLVIFVDADASALPGSVASVSLGSDSMLVPPDAGPSSHHVGAGELLTLARELHGAAPPAFAVGIGGADLELGEGLSPSVEAALPRAAEVVLGLVASHRMP